MGSEQSCEGDKNATMKAIYKGSCCSFVEEDHSRFKDRFHYTNEKTLDRGWSQFGLHVGVSRALYLSMGLVQHGAGRLFKSRSSYAADASVVSGDFDDCC